MSSPRRVLHVLGGMDRGGAETTVMNLYRRINRREIQFDFAVQTARACHYDSEIDALGGRIFRLPVPAEAGSGAWAAAFLRSVVGEYAAVHSHVHYFSGLVLDLSRRRGVPVRISHSHTTAEAGPIPFRRRAYERYMRFRIRSCATHMLGCSRPACESLFGSECWSDPRVRVAPNAIPLSLRDDPAECRRRLLDELRLPPETALVGHVGSFTEAKNHRFTVQVFEELARRIPAARLLLIGDGPLRGEIEESVRAAGLSGQVEFLGVRSDVPRIMAGLDLLLLPSVREGLPVVLVEAQAAGTPCLVSAAVTADADLGVGLIRFAALGDGAEAWVENCLAQMRIVRPPRALRERALRDAGYDVADAARKYTEIYTNRAAA